MVSTLVYFVRHGQTTENLLGIIQGQLDTQLDDVGMEQATGVARALKDIKFDVAFTSDLTRTVDTANAILEHHAGIPLKKLSILRERYMGNLQGQLAFPKIKRPPLDETVETSAVFQERILQFWDEVVLPLAKEASETWKDGPRCILVVSHGAFIGTLARALVGHRDIIKPRDVMISWCPNASITLFEVGLGGTGYLRSFGDMSHFGAEPARVENPDELNAFNRGEK